MTLQLHFFSRDPTLILLSLCDALYALRKEQFLAYTLGLRSTQQCISCLFLWNVPDVSVFVSSVNMNIDLPGTAIVVMLPIGFRFFLPLAVHSGPPEKIWELYKSSPWMAFLCSNRIYGWVRTLSHTHTKNLRKRHAKGPVKRKWFVAVQSMDTIHCQDALDSPHTDSWKSQDFHSLTEVKRLQSNMLPCTWKLVAFLSANTISWWIPIHFFVIHLQIAVEKHYCYQFGFVNVRSQHWFPKGLCILKICALIAFMHCWNSALFFC